MPTQLEVEHRWTTLYHPRTNGVVEQKVRDVLSLTKKCIKAKENVMNYARTCS
jgi:hypothetical protein